MALLEVNHLKKYYASQKAVDDISFSIARGSIFGLLGPNGAGKTTLLRMITGIFYPDEGQIIFEGRPFEAERDILRIGYMPEERGLYKKMKIGEQVLYLAQLKGLNRQEALEKVKRWFQKFGMESWWNRKVEDLSKGMQQKLQFVTTVLHEPSLIILDEPFSGLDPVNANLIRDEIHGLAERGCTIIFSTHRMAEVEEICDQIVLINKGRKVLDGAVGTIKEQFKEHRFLVKTAEGQTLPPGKDYRILDQDASEFTIQLNGQHDTNALLSDLIRQNITIRAFNEILPSLNDIFIRLVNDNQSTTRAFQNNLS
ncbi:ABC transporter ATP-binding protein [Flavihumibacter petaseus]|uniref:Putative ABC transporter ATP-binding protein n=1 Tax=Flavihumibacter petaseus NBRC 106054 TaxID=1220578 RepID=A0A0E9N6D7_9BACT|nr:ABC transporter ATP-binding protein [Flavihumibacter petaseus]GAO44905.1 putative ABC transporter ATP-binding protein [Flavihumibacter petaseus NBRC 106054]